MANKLTEDNQLILHTAMQVLEENHPVTARRLHYLLAGEIPSVYKNTLVQYNTLLRLITNARKRGTLDYEMLDDPSRVVVRPVKWSSVEAYATSARHWYERDRWQNLSERFEVWVEKDTVLSVFRPICSELQLTLRSMHGQASNTACYTAAKTFSEVPENIPITVLYFGDQDPNGESIPASAKERTEDILVKRFGQYRDLNFNRLGFNYEDFDVYGIESIDEKPNDKQLRKYLDKYGKDAKFAELDSLPTDVLVGRVRAAVADFTESSQWQEEAEQEAFDKERIREALESLN
jgi:hypothetical protein